MRKKIFINTYDVFNDQSDPKSRLWLDSCKREAVKCNLDFFVETKENGTVWMNLKGSKRNMIKYYFSTLFKTRRVVDGIKRLISIIFT